MRFSLSTFTVLIATTSATCWTYNGTDRARFSDAGPGVYKPCAPVYPGDQFSMCCRSGWDECQQDTGLCFSTATQQYWRESCTDITWESENCLNLFTNATQANITDILVTKCGDGRWCYGSNNVGCCKNGEGYYIVDGKQSLTPANAISNSTNTSTSAGASAVTGASTSASTSPNASTGLSTGAKAGIGVGVTVAALILVGIIAFFCLRKTSREKERKETFLRTGQDLDAQEAPNNSLFEKTDAPHIPRDKAPVYEKADRNARYGSSPVELST